jgi:lysophospholipase L1-like esterase
MSAARKFAIKAWDALHAFWIIIGISLAMLLLMETCVRVADRSSPRTPAGKPQVSLPWYADYTRDYDATRSQRWKSYVYFGRLPSYKGRYINIDSLGHRVTPQPATPAVPSAKVFFFGGSTLWGTDQRDDHTIPAEASRRLQALAGPGRRIEVSNLGETGYVTTQDFLALLLELRAGNIPDVVVFYDGINDVGTTVQFGTAGLPQNESKRSAEFALGRAIDRSGYEQGFGKDMKAWRALSAEALKQSALYNWAQSKKPRPQLKYIAADSAARGAARVYVANMRAVEALARMYGFDVLYVWQPNLHSTQKVLTPFESALMRSIKASEFDNRIRETQLLLPAILDTAMASVAPGRFIDESSLFRGDTLAVFTDRIGHNTEAAVPTIVDGFWPALQSLVTRRLSATRPK